MNPVCRMHSRLFLLALALLLCGCASLTTTTLKPTDTTRNSTTAEKSATIQFQEHQLPSTTRSSLELAVVRRVTVEETFQRQYVTKRILKPGTRAALWLGGAAIAGGGYYVMTETGWVMLGKDLMALGALVPLGAEIITASLPPVSEEWKPGTRAALWLGGAAIAGGGYYVMTETGWVMLGKDLIGLGALLPLGSELVVAGRGPVSEEWKPESRTLPARTMPAANTDIVAAAGSSSWAVQTDNDGQLVVDVSTLVDMADPGQPLAINFALQEDTSQSTIITVPAAVLDAHRPAPPVITEADVEPVSTPPPPGDISSLPTIAILDFEGIGVSAEEARVLTNRLGTHMVQLGRYQVIERGQMEQILNEQDFQMTGCTSNECAVEIGQLIGAGQMLAGSFGRLGTVYTIDMRIIDVLTGRITKTTSYDIEGSISRLLTEGLAEAVKRIAGSN